MVAATGEAGGGDLGYAGCVTAAIAVTLAALAALLVAEQREWRTGIWIFKPLASTAFIATALAAGALEGGSYGALVLAGLVLSWWGDVLLIPEDRPAIFRAGILAFLLGHVAYVVAFASRGLDPTWATVTIVVLVAPVVAVVRWLRPNVPAELKIAVYAYVAVISMMLISAFAAWPSTLDPRIPIGALMFYVSDLAVARDRFIAPGFSNRTWGLPLYYGGQLVLASTAGG
jgi:uncharacterized membrane protein YhhN